LVIGSHLNACLTATGLTFVLTWKRRAFNMGGRQMSVIAPDEKADFVAILHCHQLAEADFMLQETGTTDVVDEVYPLQGCVTIVRRSTLAQGKGIPNRTWHRMDRRI
jgi:hypothetical protein